jgi:membrane-bound lytic murein transglycosylase B
MPIIRKTIKGVLGAALISLGLLAPAEAASKAEVEKMFRAWIDNDLWPAAQKTGVSERTFRAAMQGVALNWDLPDLVPPGSKPKKDQAARRSLILPWRCSPQRPSCRRARTCSARS